MLIHYLLLISASVMLSKLSVRPLRALSYTDTPLFYDDMGCMLSVLLSVSFTVSFYVKTDIISKILMVILLFCLCCITYTDSQAGYIYDRFHIVILLIGIAQLFIKGFSITDIQDSISGCIIGGGFLQLMNCLSILVFKKEGIGGGDVKLCFACGLILGLKGMISAFIFAFFPAALYAFISGAVRGREVALGPFLCVSIAAVYCIGML
ncbi:MAG TPA: prepilin peptidase [Clostridia bacterium]|jgi:leader peptidase (prepilin peptidase)/N-methyltransferase|nr:hypothetical protein [Clostridiaceae bacterium]HOF26593.1 prepilin peptidase [Clostridia bacterium]HOM34286.1 prepilin peptidase [Clostridia bacterium]HOR89409.1 prepilin peptidase [Clostridia bacterium]HOT70782.1 prepilin peptidase [Clostridia bacterium]